MALFTAAALTSCGPDGLVPEAAAPPKAAGDAGEISPEALDLGGRLAAIRAQCVVAVELSNRRLFEAAKLHVDRAREEAAAFPAEVANDASNAVARLSSSLEAAARAVEEPDTSALPGDLAEAGRATVEIESAVLREISELAAYKASVVSELLQRSSELYADALTEVGVDPRRYRDAYGLLREAQYLSQAFASVVEQQTSDELRAGDTLMAAMFGAMPSSEPPEEVTAPEDVAGIAYLLRARLAEQHDALAPKPALPGQLLSWLGPALDEVLASYESGEAGVAEVLAKDTYAALYRPAVEQLGPAPTSVDDLGAVLRRLNARLEGGASDDEIDELVSEGQAQARVASDEVG